MCAEVTSIGILIHEMPFISGHGGHIIDWPIDLLDRLADVDNIIAIKEDTKSDDYSRKVIKTISDRMSVIISGGGKRQWLQFADMGCQSWLNGIGVFEPLLAHNFYKAYVEGNHAYTQKVINEIEVPFFEKCVQRYGWHLSIKSALEAQGHMQRNERMPMLALNDVDHRSVVDVISSLPISDMIAGI